jgi:signal transduction histidine kinase
VSVGLVVVALGRQAAQYEQRVQEARTERQTALEQVQALLAENGRLQGELQRIARQQHDHVARLPCCCTTATDDARDHPYG